MDRNNDNSTTLADRMAIGDLLLRHSRGLDRGIPELIRDCYWPEAEVDYGVYRGPAQPFAELVVEALTATYELTRHALSNTLYQFESHRALTETYVDANHLLQGGAEELRVGSRYLDSLEQREGQWRILHRQVVIDWSRSDAITDQRDSDAFGAFSKGRNDRNDPLHTFLGARQ